MKLLLAVCSYRGLTERYGLNKDRRSGTSLGLVSVQIRALCGEGWRWLGMLQGIIRYHGNRRAKTP